MSVDLLLTPDEAYRRGMEDALDLVIESWAAVRSGYSESDRVRLMCELGQVTYAGRVRAGELRGTVPQEEFDRSIDRRSR